MQRTKRNSNTFIFEINKKQKKTANDQLRYLPILSVYKTLGITIQTKAKTETKLGGYSQLMCRILNPKTETGNVL